MSKIKELDQNLVEPTEQLKEIFETDTMYFTIVKQDNHYIIVSGNKMATKRKFRSVESAKRYINTKPYELIWTMIYIGLENLQEIVNNNKK